MSFPRPKFNTYAQLKSYLTTYQPAAALPLYPTNSWLDSDIIGYWKYDSTLSNVRSLGWIDFTKSNGGAEFSATEVTDVGGTAAWVAGGLKVTGGDVDLTIGIGISPQTPKAFVLMAEGTVSYTATVGAAAVFGVMARSAAATAKYSGPVIRNNTTFQKSLRYNTSASPSYAGVVVIGTDLNATNLRLQWSGVYGPAADDKYDYKTSIDDSGGTWTGGLGFGQYGAASTIDLGATGSGWEGCTLLCDEDGGGTLEMTISRIFWRYS